MKKVFLISGKAQSGKNQLAEFLFKFFEEKMYHVQSDLYAGPLKDWCKEDFHNLSVCLNDIAEEIKAQAFALFNIKDQIFHESHFQAIENAINKLKIDESNWYENKTLITRTLLQIYGTEIFRNRVDSDWWVKLLKERIGLSDAEVILITDCRFPNEVISLSTDTSIDMEVYTIRIERTINTGEIVASHDSETSLDDWNEWDFIVENNGSLEDLKVSAEVIVKWILEKNQDTYVNYFTKCEKGLLT